MTRPSTCLPALALCTLLGCARPPAPRPLLPAWSASGLEASEAFGTRAMAAGDVNGDSYGDLIVGAPHWGQGKGRAVLFLSSAKGLQESSWSPRGGDINESLASRVGQAGDVNGDGYGDLFVTSPGYRQGLGRVMLYFGSKQGPRAQPDWQVSPRDLNTFFGDCTHPTGDLNGDGYDDLAVGAYGHGKSRGRLRLYLGGPKGLPGGPAWVQDGDAEGDWFGYGIGAAGDVNGDGKADLLAGAKYNDQGGRDAGKAYLYYGASPFPGGAPAWSWQGPRAEANATVRLATAGDVNGDGYADLLITAPGTKGDGGAFYLFWGGASGLATWPDQSIPAPGKDLEFFGQGACPAGDLDGDGYGEVAVHGRKAAGGLGQVFIYQGASKGLRRHPSWVLEGATGGDRFGWWVAPAGDLDADGLADLVVSAESQGPGAVYVYFGKQFTSVTASQAASRSRPSQGYLPAKSRKS